MQRGMEKQGEGSREVDEDLCRIFELDWKLDAIGLCAARSNLDCASSSLLVIVHLSSSDPSYHPTSLQS